MKKDKQQNNPDQQNILTEVINIVASYFGIDVIGQTFLTAFKPLTGVRNLLASKPPIIKHVILAYIQLLTILPPISKIVFRNLGILINYPVMYIDKSIESDITFHLLWATSSLIVCLLIFSIPKSWFKPSTHVQVVATTFQIGMYMALYKVIEDLTKAFLWVLTQDMTGPHYVGVFALLFNIALYSYILRKALKISWKTIAFLLFVFIVYTHIYLFIVISAEIVDFGPASDYDNFYLE